MFKKPSAASMLPGVCSPPGAFVNQNPILLQEGLMGGELATAWPLLDWETRKPLLSYSRLKKIDEKKYHEFEVSPQ